jgi:predicted ArsR family transcriptional regulator
VVSERLLAARILALLEEHGSCRLEEAAAQLEEPPAAVRDALSRLRGLGMVEVVSVGEVEAHRPAATSHWGVTDLGRAELARLCARDLPRAAPNARDRSPSCSSTFDRSRGRAIDDAVPGLEMHRDRQPDERVA